MEQIIFNKRKTSIMMLITNNYSETGMLP